MTPLSDRTVLITGAASGIGRALAYGLAEAKCHLALVDVNAQELAETAANCAQGQRITTHTVDVSDRDAMAALPATIQAAHGGVNVLINNAGITVEATFHEHTLEDWDRVIGVNLWGVIHGCHFFLPQLMAADEAHIVNISSIFGVMGVPGNIAYCASKFGVRGLTETLWEEFEGSHIHVTAVHPGGVNTNIVQSSRHADQATHDKITAFFKRKTMAPERAAAQIIEAIRANSPRLVITRDAIMADRLKRMMPVRGNRIFAKALVKAMGLAEEVERKRRETFGPK